MSGSIAPVTQEARGSAAVAPFRSGAGIAVCGARARPARLALFCKRLLDVAGAGLALLLLAPALAAIAAAIRLESRGPVIYASTRVGRGGKLFRFYKFRTMVNGAEEMVGALRARNERSGILFKIARDPRVTRVGRVLRRYSLDELPQLLNVLLGDMSLVGPRPALVSEVEQYPPACRRRLEVTPGITGLWQVRCRRDPSWDSYVALDLYYVAHWSLWLDVKVLLQTIPAVLRGTGE